MDIRRKSYDVFPATGPSWFPPLATTLRGEKRRQNDRGRNDREGLNDRAKWWTCFLFFVLIQPRNLSANLAMILNNMNETRRVGFEKNSDIIINTTKEIYIMSWSLICNRNISGTYFFYIYLSFVVDYINYIILNSTGYHEFVEFCDIYFFYYRRYIIFWIVLSSFWKISYRFSLLCLFISLSFFYLVDYCYWQYVSNSKRWLYSYSMTMYRTDEREPYEDRKR